MAKHGIVRTDNLHGTKDGADLVSIRYKESSVNVAIDNGNFCTIGAYETGEREVRVGGKPAANTSIHNLCLIASEEVDKAKAYTALGDFENKAGAICRGYKVDSHGFFALTEEAFEKGVGVTPTVGTSILEAQAKTKALLVNAATSGSTKIADLVAIEASGGETWYVFETL